MGGIAVYPGFAPRALRWHPVGAQKKQSASRAFNLLADAGHSQGVASRLSESNILGLRCQCGARAPRLSERDAGVALDTGARAELGEEVTVR
jgi:hypothetical protein